jgi:hypothetical protein
METNTERWSAGQKKKSLRLHLSLACMIAAMLAEPTLFGQAPATSAFQIHIPTEIKPETVMIYFGVSYGQGFSSSTVTTKQGVYDYPLAVADRASSLKLLIYIPGYKMVTEEFHGMDLKTPKIFVPALRALPTVPLTGRLVDSSNHPIPNQNLVLKQDLEDMNYFSQYDGGGDYIEIGRTRTDADGAFKFDVPAFPDDPYFEKDFRDGNERIFLSSLGTVFRDDDTLQPSRLSAQKSYPDTLVVRKTQHGILSGLLGKTFLQQNGVTGDMSRYIDSVDSVPFSIRLDAEMDIPPDGHVFYNANLKADGTFEVSIPPGIYDLTFLVLGPGFELQKEISVEKGLLIQEGQEKIVQRP